KRLGLRCVSSFCQAEGGIRYCHVIGVQTCALPISCARDHVGGPYLLTEPHREPADLTGPEPVRDEGPQQSGGQHALSEHRRITRSEERRVGPECRWSVWSQTATQTDGRALGAL